MKTITLVAYNRLHYLVPMIESLKRNNLDGYTLFIGVEPDNSSVVDYCRTLDFMPTEVTINSTRLGVAWNPFATISRAFDSGSDFNVALEEDIVLAPDAIDLANWFLSLKSDQYFCLGFLNYKSNPVLANAVEETDFFTPLGYCVTAKIWKNWIKPAWMSDERGWDFSVTSLLARNPSFKTLHPALARSNHIGREGGEHCTTEFHDRTFEHLALSDGCSRNYQISNFDE